MPELTSSIVMRYGEISLKGKNKPLFIAKLRENIRECLKRYALPYLHLGTSDGRVIIKTDKILTYKEFQQYVILKTVFGVQDIGFAWAVDLSLESVKHALHQLNQDLPPYSTFRITTKRLDKTIPYSSMDLDKALGAYVVTSFNKKVSLKQPDLNIELETAKDAWYIVVKRVQGFSGFPTNSQGAVGVYIDNEKAILAGLLMLKTGCKIVLFVKKNIVVSNEVLSLLQAYSYGFKLRFIYIDDEASINTNAKKYKLQTLSVSQNLDEIKQISNLYNLQPLITFTEQEIKEQLEEFEDASIHRKRE